MRRSDQPSRPRAKTCCFFSSFKTLAMPMEATSLRGCQCPRRRSRWPVFRCNCRILSDHPKPANEYSHLEKYAANPKLKAVRHVLHDESDDSYILRDDFNRGIAR